jgi:hypothetical protein
VQDLSPSLTPSVVEQVAQPTATPTAGMLTQVNVPCNGITQNNVQGLRSCSGSGGSTGETGALSNMVQNLKNRIQFEVDGGTPSPTPLMTATPATVAGMYQGCEHSSVVSGVCSDGAHGVSVPHYVTSSGESYAYMCFPSPNIYNNNKAETATDHHGLSCGQWSQVTASRHGKKCDINLNETHPYHTLEETYLRGAEAQGMACHLTQVVNEMNAGILKLSNVGTTPSPCAAIFKQITDLQSSAAQQEATLQASLANQPNVKETELCTNTTTSTDPNNPDVGPLRQSACQLKSIQQSLEATFVQMAACEVTNRLMHSYQQFLYFQPDGEDGETFNTLTLQEIKSASGGSCNSSYAESEYQSRFMQEYNKRVSNVWGNCQ